VTTIIPDFDVKVNPDFSELVHGIMEQSWGGILSRPKVYARLAEMGSRTNLSPMSAHPKAILTKG